MAEVSSAWLRAALPLCLLGMLERGESYGYALLQDLSAAGLANAKAATLYPALTRLEEEGAVAIRWSAGEGGPGRKYYSLTDAGRERLVVEYRAWRDFDGVVTALAGAGDQGEPGEHDDAHGRQVAETKAGAEAGARAEG
ncbi:PadR family transcriptional regulator [Streptomyces longisporoflavus]|uniref:PadR family transcriptional regulator n=1 Tax=Streptomyces longisporoflavus TaxID=28044 RepID=UPI00167D85C8|nr:PadR family transcriptional regulator [Streptomyces longisporoflavus]